MRSRVQSNRIISGRIVRICWVASILESHCVLTFLQPFLCYLLLAFLLHFGQAPAHQLFRFGGRHLTADQCADLASAHLSYLQLTKAIKPPKRSTQATPDFALYAPVSSEGVTAESPSASLNMIDATIAIYRQLRTRPGLHNELREDNSQIVDAHDCAAGHRTASIVHAFACIAEVRSRPAPGQRCPLVGNARCRWLRPPWTGRCRCGSCMERSVACRCSIRRGLTVTRACPFRRSGTIVHLLQKLGSAVSCRCDSPP